ncbi:hypothetical protein Dform_01446 [Dehalogenimonas formicexedens]|uniref:Uncharacterized protein n=2 Tax=Dehalogenimonas TaxID=670486 RepID=A0A1P8F8J0_9CHLR|nr:hypothetical protein Dform_01446 [Dehalogenimonas formicexedens]KTB48856.1 hypothetical protein DEALK_17030 [Dehalogenimonas alkenigignens]
MDPKEMPDKSLTGIPLRYTIPATFEGGELDDIMLQHFFNTIAEVALSVASRGNSIREVSHD